jgi:hypothetical protein
LLLFCCFSPTAPTIGSSQGEDRVRNMAEQLTKSERDSLMSAVEKELIAFERKERELRKQERLERAPQKFPALVKELQS